MDVFCGHSRKDHDFYRIAQGLIVLPCKKAMP